MSDPTRPADVPHTVGLRELADDYHRHVLPLVEHRHQIVALADGQRAAHAVAALVYGHAMSERALHSRWSIAADALVAGAALGQVGAAMGGLEPDEVRAGLRRWAGAVSGTSEQTRSERRSSHRHAPTRDDMTQQLRRHGPSRPDPQYSVASALTRKRSALAGRADLQDGACHPDDLPEGATTRPPVGRAWRGR
ncbi:MAG: hypothetical protein M3R63_14380 [Actinomycetota bacterium]|nr:hypothetical protein [Actinomycetota bacterium]